MSASSLLGPPCLLHNVWKELSTAWVSYQECVENIDTVTLHFYPILARLGRSLLALGPFRLSKLGMASLLAPFFRRNGPLWEVRGIEISTRDRRGTSIRAPFLV